ncbi:MAG: thioredoxin-dependent thiol peroxidase [Micavibrio aeruginosavorus]|uniref:thioredoxin-dependent peroxiredoxin n=1 Tax=Micavibrio aeruginosavorus TaxID=349221 RepID=A0A2W5PNW9_9BACT|nr:MAG: thioredoxin-dependent thiol peroxidase [Micavibrio aeruginosavorus]
MTTLTEGSKAPEIDLPTDNNGRFKLSDKKGEKVLVYFYPKDDTSGCTAESCSFSENIKSFEKLGVAIVGISKCSVKKHDKFKAKYDLQFPLASDEEGDVCERYGVWAEKSMYGRKYMGIERSTFLIDENGRIEKIWSKVKVPGHTEDILSVLKGSKKAA